MGASSLPRGILLLAALAPACADTSAPTPRGEALLLIDTDASVPKLAGRLRVDVFTTAGVWYATRDVSLGKATAWPASFAIALPDGTSDGWAVVRLRAYPEGGTRDYLGERYAPVATPCNQPSCSTAKPAACCLLVPVPVAAPASGPVLRSGQTPSTEPDPLLAIDRLVLVHAQAGTVGSATVVLATACAATMANITDFTALFLATNRPVTELAHEGHARVVIAEGIAQLHAALATALPDWPARGRGEAPLG